MEIKVNITKKKLIIFAITFAVVGVCLTSGYFWGYNNGVKSTENPKGNGSHFYMESYRGSSPSSFDEADQLLYHSTLDCPNISYGAEKDRYGVYYNSWPKRKVAYSFCYKCMDNELIENCRRRIENSFPEDVTN